METEDHIIKKTVKLFAVSGYGCFNIRDLGKEVGIAPSVIYHYFGNKDDLLKAMFDRTNTELGIKRSKLPPVSSTRAMLKQRIGFQLDHAKEIVAVLKYYLAFRERFSKLALGFIPEKGYLHIEEVLSFGIENGELEDSIEVAKEAKVITHAINGFLLEYYPKIPRGKEREELIDTISEFILRAFKWR